MELVNDLIGIISIYTATQSTLSLLLIDRNTVHYVYKSLTWKVKAYYEARGLIANDDVVASAGWWAYYLMRNQTFYGSRYIANVHGPIITFIHEWNSIILEQYPTGDIKLWTYAMHGLINRIVPFRRKVIYGFSNVIVTEDGAVYEYKANGDLIRIHDSITSIVKVIRTIGGHDYMLLRDGTIVSSSTSEKTPGQTLMMPVVVGRSKYTIVDMCATGIIHFLTNNGYGIYLVSDTPYPVKGSVELNTNTELMLTYNITRRLREIGRQSDDVVKSIYYRSRVIDTSGSLVVTFDYAPTFNVVPNHRHAVRTAIYLVHSDVALIIDI